MTIDPSVLLPILTALGGLAGWLVKQASAVSKQQRMDLRRLRASDLARRRYIHRLEAALADYDLPLPDHPPAYPIDGADDDD